MNGHDLLQLARRSLAAGEVGRAEALYRQALASDRDNVEVLVNLGTLVLRRGNSGEAVDLLRRAARKVPGDGRVQQELARAYVAAGELSRAVEACRRAVEISPEEFAGFANLGVVLARAGRHAEAEAAYRKAVSLPGGDAAAHVWLNLSLSLRALGELAESLVACDRAVALAPGMAEAHEYRGLTLAAMNRDADAVGAYRESVRLAAGRATAWNNLGASLQKLGHAEEAARAFRKALAIDPGYAEAENNLGTALIDAGHPAQEAISHYETAIELAPARADFRVNAALARLAAGDFERGWLEHEHRLKAPKWAFMAEMLNRPMWQGEPIKGKTLLIHAEQGFGDTLQFVRFVPEAVRRSAAARVIVQCQDGLEGLLATSLAGVEVVPRGKELTAFDVQVPLLSLPAVLGILRVGQLWAGAYLKAQPELVEEWGNKLGPRRDGRRRVGLVWAGSTTDPHRALSLGHIRPLLELDRAEWFSLQVGTPRCELQGAGMPAVDLGKDLESFSDTAAVMMCMDAVVTIDTAAVHLAGGLGRETHVLLRYAPDWRWVLEKQRTPWYPTAQLYRQPAAGDWSQAVEAVTQVLRGPRQLAE